MHELTITPFLNRAGFFIAERHTGWCLILIRIKHHDKTRKSKKFGYNYVYQRVLAFFIDVLGRQTLRCLGFYTDPYNHCWVYRY